MGYHNWFLWAILSIRDKIDDGLNYYGGGDYFSGAGYFMLIMINLCDVEFIAMIIAKCFCDFN